MIMLGIAKSSVTVAAMVENSPERTFHIDSQPLGDALQEFACQGSVQVIFFSSLVEGQTAPAIRGRFTVIAALELLLAGSGLTYAVVDSQTFEIRRRAVDQRWSLE